MLRSRPGRPARLRALRASARPPGRSAKRTVQPALAVGSLCDPTWRRRKGRPLQLLLAILALCTFSTPAFADATLFIGSTTTPANRTAKGLALGVSLLVVGFEFEFADSNEAPDEGAPSLRTGMGNVLLQTPFPVAGIQFYVTTGAGLYREQFGARQETHAGFNTGGGAKISLLGPIRVRLDYRVFKLRGEPLHSTVHRIYAGLNLAF